MRKEQAQTKRYLVGTCGFSYSHWRGVFYPQGLPQGRWLEYYAQRFNAVEINNSFYRLPSTDQFKAWAGRTPPGFVFAVKASRFITHVRRLKAVDNSVATMFSRMEGLGEKLGPVLYQLPPDFQRDDAVLEEFVSVLPAGFKHVVEFRNDTWHDQHVLDLLRHHGVALCIHDHGGSASPVEATAGFAYLRLHGPEGVATGYTEQELTGWARALGALAAGPSAYAFFNNDDGGHAVRNAADFALLLTAKGAVGHARTGRLAA